MKNFSRFAVLAMLAGGLAGCGTVPESIVHQPTTAPQYRQQYAAAPAPANGAIFQANSYRPMFEDRRARMVGDIVTIVINEKTSAGKSSGAAASKSGSTDAGVTRLFGVPQSTLAKMGIEGSTSNKFEEKGSSSSSNNFSGTITATVVDVLPNGNLLVSGEKQVAFDKGVEYVRFSGVISPQVVAAGNIVSSTQVADARIEYRTNTRVDRAEMMSQLARFFFSILPL